MISDEMRDEAPGSGAAIAIMATQLSSSELARALNLSEPAYLRRKAKDSFSRADKSQLVRIGLVLERAQRVLGAKARGMEWLKSPNRALYFSAPLALLDSKEGAQRVFAVLARMEGGTFA
jgi:putative toxin-antitoxin system antitoxin component (TIGR02293 family)